MGNSWCKPYITFSAPPKVVSQSQTIAIFKFERFIKELNDKNIEKVNVFGGAKKTYNNYSKSSYKKDDGYAKYNKTRAKKSEDYSFEKTSQQTKINSNQLSIKNYGYSPNKNYILGDFFL